MKMICTAVALLLASLARADFIEGEILQVLKDGVLVTAGTPASICLECPRRTVFVENPPGLGTMIDGQRIAVRSSPSGRYQYTTTTGAQRTVEKYDCKELEQAVANQLRMQEQWDDFQKTQQIKAAAKAEIEKRAQLTRVLAYQLQQASNGYPSFQIEVGKRYLRGLGVETNLALAKHWLQSACTNGEPQATNLLSQLK